MATLVIGKRYHDEEIGIRYAVVALDAWTVTVVDENGDRRLLNRWMCEASWKEE